MAPDLYDDLSAGALRQALSAYGLRPRKSLGQHFLVDQRTRQDILAALELEPGDQVLEIGPGPGNLTVSLAAVAARVLAVEVDAGLARVLAEQVARWGNVDIRVADVLAAPLEEWLVRPDRWKMAGNLPYYITSPIIFRLLELTPPPPLLVLMVQKEFADRLSARPGTPDYGLLTVTTAFHASVEVIRQVASHLFWPRPEVASALVRLRTFVTPPFDVNPAAYERTARAAFGYRRKTLGNALAHGLGRPRESVDAAIRAAGFDPDVRAETLSPAAFAALAASLLSAGLLN